MSDKKDMVLDESAEALFAELGGLDLRPRAKEVLLKSFEGLAEALDQEEKQLDKWRMVMTDLAHYLSMCLAGFRMPMGAATEDECIDVVLNALDELSSVPRYTGSLKIRYRGMGLFQDGKVNQKVDYVVQVGNVLLDLPTIKAIAKRGGLSQSHVPGRLQRAFEHLASLNINIIRINSGKLTNEDKTRISRCLRILRQYYAYLEVKPGRKGDGQAKKAEPAAPPIVNDEFNVPSPNLTLVAGLNNAKPETVSGLVKKVGVLISQQNAPSALDQFASVYEAMFAFKNIRSQIAKPPVEINNVRWLIAGQDENLGSAAEIMVAKKVMDKLGGSGQEAAEVINTIYGQDFSRFTSPDIGRRLGSVSTFLNKVDPEKEGRTEEEVLKNLEKQLDEVPDTVFMELVLPEKSGNTLALPTVQVKSFAEMAGEDPLEDSPVEGLMPSRESSVPTMGEARSPDGEEPEAAGPVKFVGADYSKIAESQSPPPPPKAYRPGSEDGLAMEAVVRDDLLDDIKTNRAAMIHDAPQQAEPGFNDKLLELVTFFKSRSGTKKKIKEMLRRPVEFDESDFQVIARDFKVTPKRAAGLLHLLESCFTKEGRFVRASFEKNIPAFSSYELKVFEFLWQYLKDINQREDRVAFLNSLQLLIAKMKQPTKALEILLEDTVRTPEKVGYSARNAFILSNILLRKYNKELTNDVELTPEEVLLVRDGLDRDVILVAKNYVENNQEKMFQKVRSIHRELKIALEPAENVTPMPIKYLATLEREAYIFLSLVGGTAAHTIVKSAVKEYGNPDSEIYHLKKSPQSFKVNLQLLQVAIRGLIRFGDEDDQSILKFIHNNEEGFLALRKDPRFHEMVKRLMRWTGTD